MTCNTPPLPQPVRRIGGRRYWDARVVYDALGLPFEGPDHLMGIAELRTLTGGVSDVTIYRWMRGTASDNEAAA